MNLMLSVLVQYYHTMEDDVMPGVLVSLWWWLLYYYYNNYDVVSVPLCHLTA